MWIMIKTYESIKIFSTYTYLQSSRVGFCQHRIEDFLYSRILYVDREGLKKIRSQNIMETASTLVQISIRINATTDPPTPITILIVTRAR
jgi:hypothetical protein